MASKQKSGNKQSGSPGNASSSGGGVQGGTHEQHVEAGKQSHKNDGKGASKSGGSGSKQSSKKG